MEATKDAVPLEKQNEKDTAVIPSIDDKVPEVVQGEEKEDWMLEDNQNKKKKQVIDSFVVGASIQLTKTTAKARHQICK